MAQPNPTWYEIDPMDPLVFGTGQPFSSVPGARLRSFPTPPPSTLAGMVRTQIGRGGSGAFDTSKIGALLNTEVRGPLLALDNGELVAPAPADALRLTVEGNKEEHSLLRLAPIRLESGESVSEPERAPIGMFPHIPDKPARDVPSFWRWSQLNEWLCADWSKSLEPRAIPSTYGVTAPKAEVRTHVSIDNKEGTAKNGALFSTEGRRFRVEADGEHHDLSIVVGVGDTLPTDRAVLGGEARLSSVRTFSGTVPSEPPPEVVESARNGFVRAYFATPAAFGGSDWVTERATVMGAAHGRAEVISGWAYDPAEDHSLDSYPVARDEKPQGGKPKATRRLVPAGAIYFMQLTDEDPDEREAFVRDLWGRSVHQGQDALDGFGLVFFGTWDGALRPLQLSSN